MFTVGRGNRAHTDPVKGSRFIATVAPVVDETQARALVDAVAAEFADASHHCHAWRLARPAVERCSDDGEPSGSAGRPILAQLSGRNLVDVAVVVTRYFGGTKLGVGGLVRAYGAAARTALDQAATITYAPRVTLRFEVDHGTAARAERGVMAAGGDVVDRVFGATVTLEISVAETEAAGLVRAITDATAGRAIGPIDATPR